MELVVDTSVLLAVLLSEPERAKLVALTADADLIAPALFIGKLETPCLPC